MASYRLGSPHVGVGRNKKENWEDLKQTMTLPFPPPSMSLNEQTIEKSKCGVNKRLVTNNWGQAAAGNQLRLAVERDRLVLL